MLVENVSAFPRAGYDGERSVSIGCPVIPAISRVMYAAYINRRTQIYLEEGQERQLVERARQVGRSKSALIRDAIDAYLRPAPGEDGALAGLRAAVNEATGAAPALPRGVDYVEELRAAERDRRHLIDQRR